MTHEAQISTDTSDELQISNSLVYLFDSAFENKPFENELDKKIIRFVVEWIELATDYVNGKISPIDCDYKFRKICFDGMTNVPFWSPLLYSTYSLSVLNEYRDNVMFLLRKKQQQPDLYISARPSYVLSDRIEEYFDYFEYFCKNPLSSFAEASRALRVHPTTVSRNFKQLESLFRFGVGSVTNRWLFGLRTYILFFDSKSNDEISLIKRNMESYPFLNIFSQSLTSGLHYAGFILPSDDDIASQFTKSISEFSQMHFSSWRLHELHGIEAQFWTDNFTKNGWKIPEIILDKRFPPFLGDDFKPQIQKKENDLTLTIRDFIVFRFLHFNPRRSVNEIVKFAYAIENNITVREAYYRKLKILKKGVIIPWPVWNDNYICDLQIEVMCNKEISNILLSAAKESTVFYSGLTSEGIILYLTIPFSHLNKYKEYIYWIFDELGVSEFNFTLRKYSPSGGKFSYKVSKWNYGPKGFTVEGLDVSANLFDYIE